MPLTLGIELVLPPPHSLESVFFPPGPQGDACRATPYFLAAATFVLAPFPNKSSAQLQIFSGITAYVYFFLTPLSPFLLGKSDACHPPSSRRARSVLTRSSAKLLFLLSNAAHFFSTRSSLSRS